MRWPNLAAELRARPGILKELEDWVQKSFTKVGDDWREIQDWDQITGETIKANGWSKRMKELTADPALGPALLDGSPLSRINSPKSSVFRLLRCQPPYGSDHVKRSGGR